MAECNRCGKPLGFISLSKVCADCQEILAQERIAKEEAERKRLEDEKNKRTKQKQLAREKAQNEFMMWRSGLIAINVKALLIKIEMGEKIFLYDKVYLPVDSSVVNETVVDEFLITPLTQLGLDGWDIVGVVPRTVGIALTNVSYGSSSGQTWGAGVGGNVVGVHVLIKKNISELNPDTARELLIQYYDRHFVEFLSNREMEEFNKMLERVKNCESEIDR